MSAIETARELIQEAKGADGPNGGFVTDHLDAAEHWLDRVGAELTALRERLAVLAGEARGALQTLVAVVHAAGGEVRVSMETLEKLQWLELTATEHPHDGVRVFTTRSTHTGA